MSRKLAYPLLGCLALLPALAGCIADSVEAADHATVAAAGAMPQPVDRGHALHRMFDLEKQQAAAGDLPAQF